MDISGKEVMELRAKTGAGMLDCKKALSEAGGNFEKAVDLLRKKGMADAAKKSSRSAKEGLIHAYIHAGGKIGVLLEVNCETDFVARTPQFESLVHDLAMHVAAANPLYVRREEVPVELIAKEKEIYLAQARETGKPEKVLEKIVEGKINKYLADICLVDQPFVKNPEQTIQQLVTEAISVIKENIQIRRFVRFRIGE